MAGAGFSCGDEDSILAPVIGESEVLVRVQATTVSGGISLAPGTLCTKVTACMTVATERSFDCADGVTCETDWNATGAFSVVQDPSAPMSPPNVGQLTYRAGFTGGSGPGAVSPRAFSFNTLHVSLWMRLSTNFQNHQTGTNKIVHFWINGINRLYLMARGPDLLVAVGLQQLAAPFANGTGQSGTSVNLLPNIVPSAAFGRGQWRRVDMLLTANSPGSANGAVVVFLDGVRVLGYSGIMFAGPGGSGRWEDLSWNPTWGGLGDVVIDEMFTQVDHIVVRGRN